MHKGWRGAIGRTASLAILVGLASTGLEAASAVTVTPPPLPGMSPKEARADKIWSLRAGLNVAALQCQFSPFLQTVPTYNALLRQHSDEMADSFKQMTGYFVRQKGPKLGQRAFDSYATRANQSWATFDAQYTFCDAAAMVGRKAELVHLGADRLEHRQRCHEFVLDASERHRLGAHPLDPGDPESERLCAGHVPGIGGDEQHPVRRGAEYLADQLVGLRARLEDLFRIYADGGIEQAVEADPPPQAPPAAFDDLLADASPHPHGDPA